MTNEEKELIMNMVLRAASRQFLAYAKHHAEKSSPDTEKSSVNEVFSMACQRAIDGTITMSEAKRLFATSITNLPEETRNFIARGEPIDRGMAPVLSEILRHADLPLHGADPVANIQIKPFAREAAREELDTLLRFQERLSALTTIVSEMTRRVIAITGKDETLETMMRDLSRTVVRGLGRA